MLTIYFGCGLNDCLSSWFLISSLVLYSHLLVAHENCRISLLVHVRSINFVSVILRVVFEGAFNSREHSIYFAGSKLLPGC